jgi:tetratricopeptide (TPR) repeat protein
MVQEVAEPSSPVEAREPEAPEQVPAPATGLQPAPPAFEFQEAPTAEPAEAAAFELEFNAEPVPAQGNNGPATTEDFLNELAAEIEGMESAAAQEASAPTAPARENASMQNAPAPADAATSEMTAESLNELAEVFQEFRNELGEMDEGENEDLETHYNLGIAYREMGLLDEAIGEFQKVAKAVQKGRPFPYAMNCATLLALSFMDKNEPKIAALWYKRALDMPKLDQETVLALRYDLGVALDMAGEAGAALDSFRQVYAMNIDYRDVADRIATLQKH